MINYLKMLKNYKKRRKGGLILLFLSLFFLVILANPSSAFFRSKKVWVKAKFSGGVQCESNYKGKIKSQVIVPGKKPQDDPSIKKVTLDNTPPNFTILFEEFHIKIYQQNREDHSVCEACGCPVYSFTQHFFIREKDLVKASNLGFRP